MSDEAAEAVAELSALLANLSEDERAKWTPKWWNSPLAERKIWITVGAALHDAEEELEDSKPGTRRWATAAARVSTFTRQLSALQMEYELCGQLFPEPKRKSKAGKPADLMTTLRDKGLAVRVVLLERHSGMSRAKAVAHMATRARLKRQTVYAAVKRWAHLVRQK